MSSTTDNQEHLYLVIYDIADQRRWREIYRMMHGYGEWLQLSAFQCRLSRVRHAELVADLDRAIHHHQDHVVILDAGRASGVAARVISLGKRSFEPVTLDPTII